MLQGHRCRAIVQRLPELPAVDEIGRSTAETGERRAGVRCCAEFIEKGSGDFSILLLFLGFGLVGIHYAGSCSYSCRFEGFTYSYTHLVAS